MSVELNIDFDNVEDIKDLPTGNYSGVIADTKIDKTKGGNGKDPKPYVTFFFRPTEALDGQDLEGVELNRMIRSADQFVSPKAVPVFKKRMKDAGFEPTGDLRDWLQSLHGEEVRFTVGLEKRTRQDGSEVANLRVTSFRKAA